MYITDLYQFFQQTINISCLFLLTFSCIRFFFTAMSASAASASQLLRVYNVTLLFVHSWMPAILWVGYMPMFILYLSTLTRSLLRVYRFFPCWQRSTTSKLAAPLIAKSLTRFWQKCLLFPHTILRFRSIY